MNGFTLDPSIGEFTLSHPNITCPESGKIFIAEVAGGKATDGRRRILDIQPTDLHQRSPFFVGSRLMMEELIGYMKG